MAGQDSRSVESMPDTIMPDPEAARWQAVLARDPAPE
jgi:hypothetical protein